MGEGEVEDARQVLAAQQHQHPVQPDDGHREQVGAQHGDTVGQRADIQQRGEAGKEGVHGCAQREPPARAGGQRATQEQLHQPGRDDQCAVGHEDEEQIAQEARQQSVEGGVGTGFDAIGGE